MTKTKIDADLERVLQDLERVAGDRLDKPVEAVYSSKYAGTSSGGGGVYGEPKLPDSPNTCTLRQIITAIRENERSLSEKRQRDLKFFQELQTEVSKNGELYSVALIGKEGEYTYRQIIDGFNSRTKEGEELANRYLNARFEATCLFL